MNVEDVKESIERLYVKGGTEEETIIKLIEVRDFADSFVRAMETALRYDG